MILTMPIAFRCPVCGGHEEHAVHECPTCQTRHHQECWDWIGGCSIFGCASARVDPRTERAMGDPSGRAPVQSPDALPQPAARGDLVLESTLQQDAFAGHGPLPPGVRALYFSLFALLLPVLPPYLLPFAIVAAGAPLAMTRFRWRFEPDTENLVGEVIAAGMVVRRRTIPFHDVQRVEWGFSRGLPQLSVVLTDGTTLPITYDVPPTRGALKRMVSVARGVQAHAPLHVTTSEMRDPVTMRKRLESLKLLATTSGRRAEVASLGARATLAGMLAAVLVAGGGAIGTGPVGLFSAILAGGIAYATAVGWNPRPLEGLRDGHASTAAVVKAENALRDMHPKGAQAGVTLAGNLALIATTFLLMLVKTQLAHIGLLCLCAAAVINAVDWAQATAVQKSLDGAELVEDPSPAPRLTASSGTESS